MSTPFQNRLVGTIIVAAVIIIFLPDVLDGEKNSNQADFEAIPDTPIFSGKLTDKTFPEEKLKIKSVEPLSDELAQDDLLVSTEKKSPVENEIIHKSESTKVTPKEKDKPLDEQKVTIKTPSLPEKAVAKQAWVIHLGSFKHKQNVAQLLAKLKKNGYTTFTQPIKTKQGTLTKVFIGPELIKSSLVKKLPELKTLTNTQGKVAPFYPIK